MKNSFCHIILLLLLIPVGIGLVSCTSGSNLEVVHDEYGGVQIIATTGVRLQPDSIATTEYLDLNILRVVKQGGQKNYRLVAEYLGNDWLLVQQGQSLVIDVDGRKMTLAREAGVDQKKVLERKRILELATYPITRAQLDEIAGATMVQVTLKGAERNVSRRFSWRTFEKFQEYLKTY